MFGMIVLQTVAAYSVALQSQYFVCPSDGLRAQLSTGLSSEYTRKSAAEASSNHVLPVEDANIAAKYYINQILSMDEASIQQAWLKVR